MATEIWVALIPSVLTLIGVWIQNSRHNKSIGELIEYRVGQLEKKQDKHNELIERVYALETAERINEKRLTNLEGKDGRKVDS